MWLTSSPSPSAMLFSVSRLSRRFFSALLHTHAHGRSAGRVIIHAGDCDRRVELAPLLAHVHGRRPGP